MSSSMRVVYGHWMPRFNLPGDIPPVRDPLGHNRPGYGALIACFEQMCSPGQGPETPSNLSSRELMIIL